MASQSLYRKWRSQTFNEMVGQEAVIRTLKNALNSHTLAHAYLFTGPRGTGKTSTARLLAKTINCLNSKDGEPCNECDQCIEITAGSSFNVIEIDAASNRGIDSIRELREKVMVPPSTGKYKVYILDEAHMLTTEAFNALLKTLEEPPAHAIFVMATTDVHKMLPTVLSRCQRFDFKRFTLRQLVDHLHYVAGQEEVTLENGAADLIARAAAGGMRDALSLLDQAIAYSGPVITLAQVQTMLGVADPRAIQKLILHIADLDSAGGLHLIHELTEAGADLRQLNTQVAEYWRAMMLARAGANITLILDDTDDAIREITQASRRFTLETLTECARVFAQNDLMQKNQGTPQLGLELALLACIQIQRRSGQGTAAQTQPTAHPAPGNEQARPREITAPTPPAQPTMRAPAPAAPTLRAEIPAAAPTPEILPPAPEPSPLAEIKIERPPHAENAPPVLEAQIISSSSSSETTIELPDWDDLSYADDIDQMSPPTQSSSTPTSIPATPVLVTEISTAANEGPPTLTIEDVKEKWEYVRRRVKTRKDGAKIAALLNGYVIIKIDGTAALPIVVLKAEAIFHYSALQKNEHQEAITWALKIELQQECVVRLLPPGGGGFGGSAAIIPPVAGSSGGLSTMSAPSPARFESQTSNSASMQMASAPQQSAYREPTAALSTLPVSSALAVKVASEQNRKPAETPKQIDHTAVETRVAARSSAPLARIDVVRENSISIASATGETRQQSIEKKARDNRVVQEAIRLFKAEIKDIQPK